MTIDSIMNREAIAARKDADENWAARKRARIIERRDKIVRTLATVIWAAVIIAVLIVAYEYGYVKALDDDTARSEKFEREQAELDKRIDAEVRAMSNYELIAATERDAAKYKTTK